jgi:hypothetical protein
MSESKTFLPTTCPECGTAKRADCNLCKGKGMVSHFVAAAWFSEHPEAARADTEREMPAVRLEDENKGERGP